jgi:alkylated DNA repair protein (DNA oxidative demethylase)
MLPEGFLYQPDALTCEEQAALLGHISTLSFAPVLFRGYTASRRAIHFGVGYDFDHRALSDAAGIPDFLLPIRERAAALVHLDPSTFSEALIMEYPPGSVIGWHRDAPKFGPIVLGVSLGSAARMRFKKPGVTPGEVIRASIDLEPRSIYALTGDARSVWQHSIPAVNALRYSITFRSVR